MSTTTFDRQVPSCQLVAHEHRGMKAPILRTMHVALALNVKSNYRFDMIIGIGTDLVSLEEFSNSIDEQPGRYVERIFTWQEITDTKERADRYQALAARLAAKEAFMKALGTGWTEDVDWLHIQTKTDETGQPSLVLSGATEGIAKTKGVAKIHVSMSHTPAFATAVVVLEDSGVTPPSLPVES
jgi:holo-[acyl-carrier protein] synthase